MLNSPWVALCITFALALAWLRVNDYAAQRGWMSAALSRKIIHIGTGPIFVLCWLLFPDRPESRFLAALIPLAITFQFFLVGVGAWKDEGAVAAMSRSGNRSEILRGPLFYGIVFVALTLIYWKTSPIGIVALMLLCGGDGLADILGRRFQSGPLPWSAGKTWIGTLAMLLGGWVFSVVILGAFMLAGVFSGSIPHYLLAVTGISIVGALVESIPFRDIDNLTVPAFAVLLGHLMF
ncbi:dolichol kinase [Longilinea arvoryzae]|uniref:Dolichol kinase n=1 Tax=Longilinea arvoryzae TaxID=360412 RepID=A0A0S7BGM2_9CHLR|nr:phosphatidate cytidylyltransferase [Longilinea arvoryzae]GAP14749.1 dolichol kinase [Longilinea arvoryzae]